MEQEPDEKERIHRPEFVLLDKEQTERSGTGQNQYFQAIGMLQKVQPSFPLQMIILLSFFLISIAALVVVFFFLINVLIAAVALFQSTDLNKYMLQSWKNVKKLFSFLAGTLIGLFSPALGLGLVILYMMKEKEPLNKTILEKIFKSKSEN